MTSVSVNQAKARIIVGLEEKLGGLHKVSVLGLAMGALVLLAGCSAKTTGATDIKHVSATLHATGRCSAGQTCTWYWEYWRRTAAVLQRGDARAGPRPRAKRERAVVDRDHPPCIRRNLSLGVLRVIGQRRPLRVRWPTRRGRLDDRRPATRL